MVRDTTPQLREHSHPQFVPVDPKSALRADGRIERIDFHEFDALHRRDD